MIAGSVVADLLIRYLVRYLTRIFARRAARVLVRSLWWVALVAFVLTLGFYALVQVGINPGDLWRSFLLSLPGRSVIR